MNRFKLSAILIALMLSTPRISAQQREFNVFPEDDDITTVYISPAAMKMGLSMDYGDDSDMQGIIKSISNPQGMEIINAETKKAADKVRDLAKEKIRKLNMEIFLDAADNGEDLIIYVGKVLDGNKLKNVLIEVNEKDKYTLLYMKGDIDINMLANIKPNGKK